MSYSELKDECIICLSDIPDVIKYDAPCECKPYIHDDCRNQWFNVNPNTCPICKINYEGVGMPQNYLVNLTVADRINSEIVKRQRLLALMILLFSMFVYFEYFYNPQ